MVGVYQHNGISGPKRWFIGFFDWGWTTEFIFLVWRFLKQNTYGGPDLLYSMDFRCCGGSTSLAQLVNETTIAYYTTNNNQITFYSTKSTDSTSDERRVRDFAVYRQNSLGEKFYLSQRLGINSTEVWLQKFSSQDNYLNYTVLPVNVPPVSRFQTSLSLSNGFVYTAVVIDSSILNLNHAYNSGPKKSDIYILRYNMIDFTLHSKLIITTDGNDNISRIDAQNDGAIYAFGISAGNLFSGQWTSPTVFAARLAFIDILDVTLRDKFRNLTKIRQNDILNVRLSASVSDVKSKSDASAIPQVYVGGRLSEDVRWNDAGLDVVVPRGVGADLLMRVEFLYLTTLTTIHSTSKVSYEEPRIDAIEPVSGPSTGGTRLIFRVQNIDDVDSLQVFIGNSSCNYIVMHTSGFSCISPPGEVNTTVPITLQAGGQDANSTSQFTYFPPTDKMSIRIRENTENTLINLTRCPDFVGQFEDLEFRITEVPDDNVGVFSQYEEGNSSHVVLEKYNASLTDRGGSVWYSPKQNFHGLFSFKYFCIDKQNTSRSVKESEVEISVFPDLICQNEILISDTIVLTRRNLKADGLLLELSKAPNRGKLIFLESNDDVNITIGSRFQANSLRYSTMFDIENRSILPFDEISYFAVDNMNIRSETCNLKFTISCAPLFLNVFNHSSIHICVNCPANAICSPIGAHAPFARQGHWKSTDNDFLPCVPKEACPGLENGECLVGYSGTRRCLVAMSLHSVPY
ncbi:hypothetical protein BKA69DRAFT_112282 [Paraphysoderma sedebokerense]|nr:hypothetical protein BKA69DRAFT_112282 [Paraphysoderma sedebokerense]